MESALGRDCSEAFFSAAASAAEFQMTVLSSSSEPGADAAELAGAVRTGITTFIVGMAADVTGGTGGGTGAGAAAVGRTKAVGSGGELLDDAGICSLVIGVIGAADLPPPVVGVAGALGR